MNPLNSIASGSRISRMPGGAGPFPWLSGAAACLMRRAAALWPAGLAAVWLATIAMLLFSVNVARAQGLPGQTSVAAVVTPTAPTYIDPVVVQVTVTAGMPTSGRVVYSVDGGTSSSAPVSNGAVNFSLGTQTVGTHSVAFQYQGTPSDSTSQAASFTVSDLPFALVWTKQYTFDNHSGWGDGAPDVNNNMLITNTAEGKLYRLDALHNLSVVPTSGIAAPVGIATDSAGDAYIADSTNNVILQLSAAGQQTTLSIAGLLTPTYVTLDPTSAYLYINDSGHSRIVRYTLATGALTEVVTSFDRLAGIATDATGRLYFAQRASYGPGGVFRLGGDGTVTGPYFGLTDPHMLHANSHGDMYVTDGYDGMERFDTAGHRTPIDGNYDNPLGVDRLDVPFSFGVYGYTYLPGPINRLAPKPIPGYGDPDYLVYSVPSGTSVLSLDTTDTFGNVIAQQGGVSCNSVGCTVGEYSVPLVPGLHSGKVTAKLSTNATLTSTVVGVGLNSNEAFDPGIQTTAPTQLTSAGGLAELDDGTLFVSDTLANQVFTLSGSSGAPSSLGFTGLRAPTQIAVDGAKTVYVLDSGNSRIVSMNAAGQQSVSYAAGTGALSTITALATDGSGALYLGGTYGSVGPALVRLEAGGQLRLIEQTKVVTTAITLNGLGEIWELDGAGTLRKAVDYGYSPAATSTSVSTGLAPGTAISADPSGTVFVAQGTAGTVVGVRPDGSTFTVYSGLGNVAAVVVDGRSVLHAIDATTNTLLADDRRTSTFAFADQAVGTASAPMVRTLSNDGNQLLTGIGGLPGDGTFQFDPTAAQACVAVVPNAGTQLAPGSFCTLVVRFDPPYVNSFSESGYEQDSTPQPGVSYTLRPLSFTGSGIQGTTAALTPAALDFGSVQTGNTAAVQVLTLQNTGSGVLNISSVVASGSGFRITANTCGTTLVANSSCTVTVSFAPVAAVAVSGAVTVTDNATNGSTQTAALSGTGVAPTVSASLSPPLVDFGTVGVGDQSALQTFVLTNTGTASLNVTSFGLAGANAQNFQQGQDGVCSVGQTLAPGAVCKLFVVFYPRTAGTSAAMLVVTDSAGTQSASLTGTATAAALPGASLTPAMQNFGSLVVGMMSAAQTFTLTDTGSATLNVQSIAIGGTDLSSFAVTGGSCSTSQSAALRPVRAGSTCTVTVVFTPQHGGAAAATLTVTDDAGVQSSALTGTGTAGVITAPQAALNPVSGRFGTVSVGSSSAAQTFTLTNAGNAALPIASAAITGANAVSFLLQGNTCGPNLAAGASCMLTVAFTPTAAGTATATLSVTDAVGTQTADLSGTASAVTVTAAAPDFTLGATPSSQTGAHGGSVVYAVQVQSVDAANPFGSPVALSVSGLPAGSGATFALAAVIPGTSQPAVSQMTLTIPALSSLATPVRGTGADLWAERVSGFLVPLGLAAASTRRRLRAKLLGLLCLAGLGVALTGCGSGDTGFALPASTSTLTITGTSGATAHSTMVTLTVR